MRIQSLRLTGIRCFEDTGEISLAPGCNIFVGQNNSGKSTLLRGITAWQLFPFAASDARPNSQTVQHSIVIADVVASDYVRSRPVQDGVMRIARTFKGNVLNPNDMPTKQVGEDNPQFLTNWPNNFVIPFVARRKAPGFNENVNASSQATVDGTFSYLYARIDRVASPGPKAHIYYKEAVESILGVFIGTRASQNGKEAGYYYDEDTFVTIDRMGDGVSEIVALLADLSLAKGKVFVLEEPETNLHPTGLKALLDLVRESSTQNQFLIATHSNIVVRELAAAPNSKLFRVYRDGDKPSSPSKVGEVAQDPSSRIALLRELGYEFGDFELHEGWLFLEEASAETIFQEILIPWFAPDLRGRLRTFSAAGVENLEPSVGEFQRLITFVHLDPVYQDRLWVRADGDDRGKEIISKIQETFPYLSSPRSAVFSQPQFERFYPFKFAEQISATLNISDKRARSDAKADLRAKVVEWSLAHEAEARPAWEASASEQIELLKQIGAALGS